MSIKRNNQNITCFEFMQFIDYHIENHFKLFGGLKIDLN